MKEDDEEKKQSKCGGQFQRCCSCGEFNTSAMPCNCLERDFAMEDIYDGLDPYDSDDNEVYYDDE